MKLKLTMESELVKPSLYATIDIDDELLKLVPNPDSFISEELIPHIETLRKMLEREIKCNDKI